MLAKHSLREAGVPTPDWFAFNETAFRELGAADALGRLEERLGFPLVVKPSRGGSALGVKFAASRAEVPEALISAFSYDSRVLLERYVEGRELAVSVLGEQPLPASRRSPQARTAMTSRRDMRSAAPPSPARPSWGRTRGRGDRRRRWAPTARSAVPALPVPT